MFCQDITIICGYSITIITRFNICIMDRVRCYHPFIRTIRITFKHRRRRVVIMRLRFRLISSFLITIITVLTFRRVTRTFRPLIDYLKITFTAFMFPIHHRTFFYRFIRTTYASLCLCPATFKSRSNSIGTFMTINF